MISWCSIASSTWANEPRWPVSNQWTLIGLPSVCILAWYISIGRVGVRVSLYLSRFAFQMRTTLSLGFSWLLGLGLGCARVELVFQLPFFVRPKHCAEQFIQFVSGLLGE